MIRISNCEDRDAPANLDRTITITGNAESVALAQYLINMRSVQLLSTPYPKYPPSLVFLLIKSKIELNQLN